MIDFRAIRGQTGQLLLRMLRERGLEIAPRAARAEAIVSYGCTVTSELPTLNGNAGRLNKLEELQTLQAAGVRVPEFTTISLLGTQHGWFGRELQHTRGNDISFYNIPHAPTRRNHRIDYWTQFIPKSREFRVWAYRRRSLAVYEKLLRHPDWARRRPRSSRLVWNYRNGYAYEFLPIEQRPEGLQQLGAAAVNALNLDFGAADVILGQDGQLYVLEVNTAMGVEGERQGISLLADKITNWARRGYPRRKGDRP